MAYKLGFPSVLLSSLAIALAVARISSMSFPSTWLYSFPIFVSLYYLIYRSWIYPIYISPLRSVPTVPGFPLWGQTLEFFKEEIGKPPRRWHKEHGPIVRYFLLFGRERLSIIDDDALKQITVKNANIWQKHSLTRIILEPMIGNGLLVVGGHTHAQQRKALAPAFSISSIKALSPVFWRKALQLSECWRNEVEKENAMASGIEVLDWLGRTTLDIIGEAGFGINFNTLQNSKAPIVEIYRQFQKSDSLWDQVFHGLRTQSALAMYLPLQTRRDFSAACNRLVGIASDIIRDKQSKKVSNTLSAEKNIIALVVRDNSTASGKLIGNNNNNMTFETMRDQVMTFLGAGHDTTAGAVAWTLHLLSKHPGMQDRLRREIREYMPFLFSPETRSDESRLASIDEDRLPYLHNVYRESLRYISIVPVNIRQNTTDDRLLGHHIPAGTVVAMYTNAIHRSPTFWGDTADVFDPDRWDNLPATYTTMAYLPFQHGPRGCIGTKFAETEIKTLLCCLLSAYRFEMVEGLADPEDSKVWRVTLRPRDGIRLKVTPLGKSDGE